MKTCLIQSPRYNCIVCCSAGLFSLDAMLRKLQTLAQLELYHAGAPILCDMRRVDFRTTRTEDMATVADLPHEAGQALPMRRVAIVAGSRDGFLHMSELARLRDNGPEPAHVFDELEPGLHYLAVPGFGPDLPKDIWAPISAHIDKTTADDDGQQLILLKQQPFPVKTRA